MFVKKTSLHVGENIYTHFFLIYKIISSVQMIVVINHNHVKLYIVQEQA